MTEPTASSNPVIEALDRFTYDPLPTPTSIRLLQVLPSPPSEVRCSVSTADLSNDGLVFDALSYTWGNPVTIHERPNNTDPISQWGEFSRSVWGTAEQPKIKIVFDLDSFAYRSKHAYQPYEHLDWNTDRVHPVQVNGRRVMVTQNLFEALKLLRRWETNEVPDPDGFEKLAGHPKSQHIWIDMICINQNDLAERSAQVAIMGTIFKRACTIIGWLGPEATQSRLAHVSLTSLSKRFIAVNAPGAPSERAIWAFEGVDEVSTVALFSLFQRLWFRRAWIVQEVVLANRLVLACGGVLIRWEVVEFVLTEIVRRGLFPSLCHFVTGLMAGTPSLSALKQHVKAGRPTICFTPTDKSWDGELRVDPMACLDFVLGVANLRKLLGRGDVMTMLIAAYSRAVLSNASTHGSKHNGRGDASASQDTNGGLMAKDQSQISLDHLLHLFRRCNATDPRDKVYSLLGITDQSRSPALDIPRDYNLPVSTLYQGTVESIIRSSNTLNILAQVQDPSHTKLPNLPSWVPDFSVGSMPTTLFCSPGQTYFSSGGTKPPSPISFDTPSGILRVEGYRLDTIHSVASTHGCYFVRTASIVAQLPHVYHPTKFPSAKPISRTEAYWRTLIADICDGAHPAPVHNGFDFADWLTCKLLHAAYGHQVAESEPRDVEKAKMREKFRLWMALGQGETGEFKPLEKDQSAGMSNLEASSDGKADQEEDGVSEPQTTPRADGNPQANPIPRTEQIVRFLPDWTYFKTYAPKRQDPVSPPGAKEEENGWSLQMKLPDTPTLCSFRKRLEDVKRGHRMFRTEDNYLGLGPISTKQEDEVWILRGASVPFVLRRAGERRYTVVGEAYVHGVMHGEVLGEPMGAEEVVLI
jgi:hypothetical protein